MGEGALAAARRLDEGTPSPRNFDRGDHRRLLIALVRIAPATEL